MQDIRVIKATDLKTKPTDESKLGFGQIFTDHMFVMDYSPETGWADARIMPYSMFTLDPATMVFHYGQAIFEGLKAYHTEDGSLQLFRPMDNFIRMNVSAERMAIPEFDVEVAMAGLTKLLEIEAGWVPKSSGTSLYIRPTIIATDPFLGVRASKNYLFFIILSPVGTYYPSGLAPISIYVESDYVRAVRGGVGFTKTAGNYAASIKAGDVAKHKGYAQVLWLDGVEQKYVEEVGAMNMFFKIDGKLITPELNGSILSGITRDSIIKLARNMGMEVIERRVSIAEVFEAHDAGLLDEAFGTGTAAVVSPVGSLTWGDREITITGGQIGETAQLLYDTLTGIQNGKLNDDMGWIVKL